MKKLMLTTAIASVLTTAAIAQTTITGELRINYKDVSAGRGMVPTSSSVAANKDTTFGFGAEQQINIQNKGKLNIGGLDYAAGFSIENDGEQTGTLFNENVYMDFTNASSGTTISFGRDHIQRSDSDTSATNLVGFTPNELTQTTNATNGGTWFAQNLGPATSQAYGIALLQNTPVGRFSYNFVPNNAKASSSATAANSSALVAATTGGTTNNDRIAVVDADTTGVAGSEAVNPQTTTAYEYGFVGNLGVTGLQAHYFKAANTDYTQVWLNGAVKAEAKNYGVRYNFGQFSAGANKKIYNAEAATLAETTETAFSIAYAVNKDLSIGVIKAEADRNTASTADQTVKGINLGYNLGPVALAAGYAKTKDALGIAGAENDVFMIRLLGAF
jgi:hypothetical protein